MKRGTVALGVVAMFALAGCASGSGPSNGGTGINGDAGAYLACTHFHDAARDEAAGVLTPDELRTKLQEVYNSAQGSTDSNITADAQQMLADVTQGDTSTLSADVAAFNAACATHGD